MSNETKEYIRLKYKGSGKENIEYIPPHADADEDKIRKHQRVAIYARVSTNKLDQTTSIELQQNHYQDMVNERQEWELVGVYKDEGISGTSIRLREGFNRMLEDCRNGKIDLIITKSISRFARNIVDCISIVRELKTLPNPVGVIFESERLYSLDSTTEMVLSMLSAIAQEEAHIRSDLVNMSLEQRFSRGIFLVNRLIGYQRNKNGSLTIIPEEAETVKVCFYLYLNGYTQEEITDIFNRYRRKSKYGETIWHSGDVSYMLRNERYCGDILSRKTYTPNYLDHKYVRNRQNRNQYFQKDHHEPIISRSVYENAVKLSASYQFTKNYKRIVPTLYIIKKGLLRGFVTVYKTWPFSYEDYLKASMEAGVDEDKSRERMAPVLGDYSVARGEMFFLRFRTVIEISPYMITFAFPCAGVADITENFEVLFNPLAKRLALLRCEENLPNAINGIKNRESDNKVPILVGKSFCSMLYGLMGWDKSKTYKIYGHLVERERQNVIIFYLDYAVMVNRSKDRVGMYLDPQDIEGKALAISYEEYRREQIRCLTQEVVTDREPSVTTQTLTAEELDLLKKEAEAIMAKWQEDLDGGHQYE